MNPTRPYTRLALLALLALACSLAVNTVQADDSAELQALKQRIEQLEAKQAASNSAPSPVASSNGSVLSGVAGKTKFTLSGYVKGNAMFSDFGQGELAGNSGGRDYYNPASIPVGPGRSHRAFDADAKQTRFTLGTETLLNNGRSVKTHIEMDFMGPIDGNERVTNGYEPELRQAFLQYDRWLVGQAWSNFQDVAALPETVDFVGPSEGTVFSRQAQVRYTMGSFSLSAENAETTLTTFGGANSVTTGDAQLPDFTARYVHKGGFGHLSAAALLRQLRNQDANRGGRDETMAYGASLSGKFNLGERDNIRAMLTYGQGIGRYVGLNLVNDAVLDADGDLEAIDVLAGFAAYQHFWTPSLRSTVGISFLQADNPVALTGTGVSKRSQSALANIIWSPVEKLDVGAELISAQREIESGADGDLYRLAFMAKYSF